MDYAKLIAELRSELQQLTGRVSYLESGLMDMKQTLRHFEATVKHADKTALEAKVAALEAAANSDKAVVLLSAATGVGGFIAKHGPRFVAAVLGILVYRGAVSADLAAQIGSIFGG